MTEAKQSGADEASENKSTRDFRAVAQGAAAGAITGGRLAAKLGRIGVAALGKAVALPLVAVIAIGAAVGASLGGCLAWVIKKAIDSRSAGAAQIGEDADDE